MAQATPALITTPPFYQVAETGGDPWMEPGSEVPPGGLAGRIREETAAALAELAILAEASVAPG